jgi:hypothetical protein
MKLVSFDVGLRNLAVCVLEGTNRSNVKITHWDLIDIMAEVNGHDKPLCLKCKKPASWCQDSTKVYMCTTHKPKHAKPPTKASLSKKTLDALKLEASPFGISGTTKKVLTDELYKHYTATAWTRCAKSCKQGSVLDLAPAIASAFESRKSVWKGADLIAFEQQPDKRMMAAQGMMHMWFVCQGYKCKGISAVHKLTNIVTVNDATKTYKGRKQTGIVHASQLVPTQELRTFMMGHPKKDDLADCFLQGLYVLEHGNGSV